MISVDWTLGLQMINFLVLLFVLNHILYKPLKKILKDRSDTITSAKHKAQNLQAEIDIKMQTYQNQLQTAKNEAAEERNKLKKLAAQQEAEILSDAREKAGERLKIIKEKVGKEAADASITLKASAESMAGEIATKILGRELA